MIPLKKPVYIGANQTVRPNSASPTLPGASINPVIVPRNTFRSTKGEGDPLQNLKRGRDDFATEDPKLRHSIKRIKVDRMSHVKSPTSPRDRFYSTEGICSCVPDPKVPRPRNAFILYRQYHQASIVAQSPQLSNPDISKLLGARWRELSARDRGKWKDLAEVEKQRHRQQHPDYKYQPRRGSSKSSGAVIESQFSSAIYCKHCDKPNSQQQLAPSSSNSSGSAMSIARDTCSADSRAAATPECRNAELARAAQWPNATFPRPNNITIPPSPSSIHLESNIGSLGLQQRRYTGGQGSRQVLPTPYRRSFADRIGPIHARQWSPANPGSNTTPGLGEEDSISASPRLSSHLSTQGLERHVSSMPFLLKVYQLSRIAPPFRAPENAFPTTRGALVAVEGDNQSVVAEVVRYLETYLNSKDGNAVKTAQGPMAPKFNEEVTISDYLRVITEWHALSREIETHISQPISRRDAQQENDSVAPDCPEPPVAIPIVILQRFQLFASNAYAVRIPVKDAYNPMEHWQWMASLWRGTIGPDVTICIKDMRPEDMRPDSKLVEVQEDLKVVVVKRATQPGLDHLAESQLNDGTLRRLGFEVEELIREVSTSNNGSNVPRAAEKGSEDGK